MKKRRRIASREGLNIFLPKKPSSLRVFFSGTYLSKVLVTISKLLTESMFEIILSRYWSDNLPRFLYCWVLCVYIYIYIYTYTYIGTISILFHSFWNLWRSFQSDWPSAVCFTHESHFFPLNRIFFPVSEDATTKQNNQLDFQAC